MDDKMKNENLVEETISKTQTVPSNLNLFANMIEEMKQKTPTTESVNPEPE